MASTVSIHHMLLFICSQGYCSPLVRSRFNTSHVTLYRFPDIKNQKTNVVSIHHMLLFIIYERLEYGHWELFQYITCYSLSGLFAKFYNLTHVSIHHMLLFIDLAPVNPYIVPRVSIHHMLLFIIIQELNNEQLTMFQYITCYSLSVCDWR